MRHRVLSAWTTAVPVLGVLAVLLTFGRDLPALGAALVGALLIVAVFAAVHHAEVVAHRIGEPYGSIVLAVAVTVIEVGLILMLMLGGKGDTTELARDTVFAAVMITTNGIVGLSLLLAARREAPRFNSEGAGAALGVVATLSTVTLVLPSFTTSGAGATFSPGQLAFAAVASLVMYAVFVFAQTRRHRDFFLPVDGDGQLLDRDGDGHVDRPSGRTALVSLLLLVLSLASVVFLAKALQHTIEDIVDAAGVPETFVGVVIALLVLLPEGMAASKAALRDRMQNSFNLAYGSAMASIGLTIPAIAVAMIWIQGTLTLGLGASQIVLLVLTVVVGTLTVIPGRATRIQGTLHLVVFAAFIYFAIAP
ncbi:ionic transporter y4hA [Galbitalea sp. SE-J8]|uniref:calcium:proton antiporter n=1 Tax=Galbitalea sp. SE-J8 TaxID=3054952 RepID=UPI00259CD834|nr:ionic transporter y4hA [Galbitalea sp. SE-J8]MDM4762096.1 ionic transporter y4hA [Galbitalea sp. SE-J8]